MSAPVPADIKLHQQSAVLEVVFDDGSRFDLPCEYLRVYSPSAEVRGHGPGQEVLQTGKENVNITSIRPVVLMEFARSSATATTPASIPGKRFTSLASTRKKCGGSICGG